MKFLVPNYSCLQNPWLRGYRPQIPVLSVLNWICWTHPKKFPGYATDTMWLYSTQLQQALLYRRRQTLRFALTTRVVDCFNASVWYSQGLWFDSQSPEVSCHWNFHVLPQSPFKFWCFVLNKSTLNSVVTLAAYRQATRNSYRGWRYHMLLVYNYVLLKMSTWCSKHVEENSILWINNNQCIKLAINV